MIGIVDYGMGNIKSVQKAMKRIGQESILTSDISLLEQCDRLILPGVGHFKEGMKKLSENGLIQFLKSHCLNENVPILGICLGFQLMTKHSEEGNVRGLGIIDAHTVKFPKLANRPNYKVPHIGWNTIDICKEGIFDSDTAKEHYYFVHSYCVQTEDSPIILSKSFYGIEFVSSIQIGNIIGMQFHPEKSHEQGISLLRKFCSM